jgi:hypothetical protein
VLGFPMPRKRLLILSCSARKRPDAGALPARLRYDGPAFRVFRRFRSAQADSGLTMYVLSAEFGLISESHPIPLYDRAMSRERAAELQPDVREALAGLLRASAPEEVLVCAGRRYLDALPDPLPGSLVWRRLEGPPGARLARLRDWLYGVPPACPALRTVSTPVRIRGREIAVTRDELLELVRQRLGNARGAALRWYSWYVCVDDVRIAPKWMVSQAVGLPVSEFSTGDARRVLAQLGIEVHRG